MLHVSDSFWLQADSQVWIWGGGGAFFVKVDFVTCFSEKVDFFMLNLGKSGPFHVHFWRKWTFSRVRCMSGASYLGKFYFTKDDLIKIQGSLHLI